MISPDSLEAIQQIHLSSPQVEPPVLKTLSALEELRPTFDMLRDMLRDMPRDCERERDRDIERLWPREKDLDMALEEVLEFCRPGERAAGNWNILEQCLPGL